MNIQKLRDELIIDEGIRYKIYFDTKGQPTMGIGHLITKKDIEYGNLKDWTPKKIVRISPERVEALFQADIEICINDCKKVFSNFDLMPEELQLILANMMFNLGIVKFSEFRKLILAIKSCNFVDAANEMENSLWFNEVKPRSIRLVKRMKDIAYCRFNALKTETKELSV